MNNGLGATYPVQQHNIYSSTTLNYTKTFNNKHNVDALIGWDIDDRRKEYVLATASGYPHDKLPESINASTPLEGFHIIQKTIYCLYFHVSIMIMTINIISRLTIVEMAAHV